jgi:hypothetical protein
MDLEETEWRVWTKSVFFKWCPAEPRVPGSENRGSTRKSQYNIKMII